MSFMKVLKKFMNEEFSGYNPECYLCRNPNVPGGKGKGRPVSKPAPFEIPAPIMEGGTIPVCDECYVTYALEVLRRKQV